MKQPIWFHGTLKNRVSLIIKDGFRSGTWFARHMEDAVAYGGPFVFTVKVTFDSTPMRWQACSSNHIPAKAIIAMHEVSKRDGGKLHELRKLRSGEGK